jgi:DNA (cytosine-5)-methyltransferase 1
MRVIRPAVASGKEPAVLDLFAGAGGFSLGFHWAGFRTTVAVDHDPLAIETLAANFGHLGTEALVRDLAILSPEDLRSVLQQRGVSDEFDVILGGPPCQGWSKVGRGKLRSLKDPRKGENHSDPRNELYAKFVEFVRTFNPRVAIMENVPGMLSHNKRNVAEDVAHLLDAAGYDVSWQLLNAAEYGVPQVRDRLFFIGVRRDLGVKFQIPPAHGQGGARLYSEVTVWDAIGDLPRIVNGSKEWRCAYKPEREPSHYAQLMRRLAEPETVFDHVCRKQNEQDLVAFRTLRQGGWYRDLPPELKRYRDDIFEDKYKKLYANRPSWCVTAHLSKDCYTHIHPTQARTISIREAARLQSFPDCFYFAGNMGSKFKLVGNAVPPLLAEKIGLAIKEQIFGLPVQASVALESSLKMSSSI